MANEKVKVVSTGGKLPLQTQVVNVSTTGNRIPTDRMKGTINPADAACGHTGNHASTFRGPKSGAKST